MKYLLPIGGVIDDKFGVLVTPASYGIPAGIRAGMSWAADNQAFTKGFNPDIFFPWLGRMEPYKSTCLFVTVPDVVGDARKTKDEFFKNIDSFYGWPVAFVAQDGQEDIEFPPPSLWDCLFVGGTSAWKMGFGAARCIQRAQKLGKHIHVGRVNWYRRYTYFRSFPKSEEFTCDGTRTRFDKNAVSEWKKYMVQPKQHNLFVHDGDSVG